MERWDTIIIGGGLAGLTAAIELAQNGAGVLVIEKNSYPKHKVCGEYLSEEVVPYLESLGISLSDAVKIDTLEISSRNGKSLSTKLPLGGVGISRYELDHRMYKKAKEAGADFRFSTATGVDFIDGEFIVSTIEEESLKAQLIIGAYGKRSNLDKNLGRPFIKKHAPWLGVKGHYRFEGFDDNLVAVHAFDGGYGGLSKTESGLVNFCYLANYKIFKKFGDIASFNQAIVARNPRLKTILDKGEPVFDKPISIAQVSFERKMQVEDHILMCGDAAGLIHPLCGNGMAMAIHSGRIASKLIFRFLEDQKFDRTSMELAYTESWYNNFGNRIRWGRYLQNLILQPRMSNAVIAGLT
ncbi:MAG: NAD(P)/FAD-dependent oxidoreductase, partial [Flavobacteriaceae bacterium]